MARIPGVIAVARQTLTHPPKPILETAILQNRGAISFYETELFQFAGPTPQLDKLKSAAAPIVAGLKSYQQFLEGDLMARHRGLAFGPGEVFPQARSGAGFGNVRRRGAGRRPSGVLQSATRYVCRGPPALESILPAKTVAA
jgi:hypothetical protein